MESEKEIMREIAGRDKHLNPYDFGVYCIEEMSELTKELCKLKRKPLREKRDVIEEIAHVILTAQLLGYSLYAEKEIEEIRKAKLLELIGGEK